MNQCLFYNAKNQYYSNNERKSEQNNLIKGIQLAKISSSKIPTNMHIYFFVFSNKKIQKDQNFQKNTVMKNEYPGVVHCVLNMPTKSH